MPFVSEAQRAYMHLHHPEIAERWEKHTPKDADLPKRVKESFVRGQAEALSFFGLKRASQELRLRLDRREFHDYDRSAAREKLRETRTAAEVEGTADNLAGIFSRMKSPESAAAQMSTRNPLDRNTAWGPPSNPAAGDTASRMSDMGMDTSIGAVF